MFDPNKFFRKQIKANGLENYSQRSVDYIPKYKKGDILTKRYRKSEMELSDGKKYIPEWVTISAIIKEFGGPYFYVLNKCYFWSCEMEVEELELEQCEQFDGRKYFPYPDSKTEQRLKNAK